MESIFSAMKIELSCIDISWREGGLQYAYAKR